MVFASLGQPNSRLARDLGSAPAGESSPGLWVQWCRCSWDAQFSGPGPSWGSAASARIAIHWAGHPSCRQNLLPKGANPTLNPGDAAGRTSGTWAYLLAGGQTPTPGTCRVSYLPTPSWTLPHAVLEPLQLRLNSAGPRVSQPITRAARFKEAATPPPSFGEKSP